MIGMMCFIIIGGVSVFLYSWYGKQKEKKRQLQRYLVQHLHRPLIEWNFQRRLSTWTQSRAESYVERVFWTKYTYCPQKRICVAGLLRNHAKQLIPFWKSVYFPKLALFQHFVFIILENGSDDDSRVALEEFQQEFPNHVHLVPISPLWPNTKELSNDDDSMWIHRIQTLAQLRQHLLSFLLTTPKMKHVDLLWMIDLDLEGIMYEDGWLHAISLFSSDQECLAVSANTITKQQTIFDTFPLIPIGYNYHWKTMKDKRAHDQKIHSLFDESLVWYRNEPLQVWSSFNGSTLYDWKRLQSLHKTRYLSYMSPDIPFFDEFSNSTLICEHTFFHLQFPENEKFYIDPLWFFFLSSNRTNFMSLS